MNWIRLAILVVFLLSLPAFAHRTGAQEPVQSAGQDAGTRINISMSFPMPGILSENAIPEDIRRKVYELATRECAVLLEVMASQCRIENISFNIGRVPAVLTRPSVARQINVSISLRAVLK